MTKMRILLVVALAIGLAGMAYAGDHDSMNLLVTPTGNISVNIQQTEYNYGSVALYNTTTINTAAITVENDGNQQSTWYDWANNSNNGWTLVAGNPGQNEFKLASSTGTGQPDAGSSDYHVLPVQGSSNSVILAGAVDPITSDTRNLWIRLTMPDSVAGGGSGAQTILYGVYAIGD